MRSIRNVNVCVVGGAGFLGSHLVNHLIEDRGCDVLVLDNLCAGRREFVHEKANFVQHDITEPEGQLLNLLDYHQIKFVFNYAAHPYVPDSFKRPLQVFNVNAMGAMKVINAAAEAGAEAILQVSSAELYGDGYKYSGPMCSKHIMLREDAPVLPHSSYGAAKAAVDYYCQAAWRERETPVIALRQFNCIGERETHPYVVPEIISQISAQIHSENDRAWVKLGNNTARDFLYAGDAVRYAVKLLEHGQFGEVYNLGSEEAVNVWDLVPIIGQLMGAEATVVEDLTRRRPWEIWHLRSDNSKIQAACFGTHAPPVPTPLQEALERAVGWYLGNGSKWPWEVVHRGGDTYGTL